ncbi:MAG: lysylphosphatidylglycerol synthase transmembrane domain-containing protein [Candidatus Omnitrophota bacterium]
MKLNKRFKNIAFYLLKISITLGLLFFLFTKIDINKMISIIKEIDLFYFSIAIILFVFNYYLGIVRWHVLLRGIGTRIPFSRVALSYLMGLAVNLFVPSTVGGDLARGIDLSIYSSSSKPKIMATVILDRMCGFIAVVVIALFSIILGYKLVSDKAVLITLGILALMLLLVILILFSKTVLKLFLRIFHKIKTVQNGLIRFNEAMSFFRSKSQIKTLMLGLSLGFLIQLIVVILFYFVAMSLRLDIKIIYFFIFIPIVSAISMIPLTIGGLGLRDTSAVFFFTRVGLSASGAFALSLIGFLFIMLAGVIGGIVYVFTLRPRRI